MSDRVNVIARTREQAHEAITHGYALAKALLADGKRVSVNIGEDEEDRSLQQNRFYWGPCLTEISEQARIEGQRYTVDAWHELFKRQFLGYEVERVRIAGRKRPVVIRRLRSTAKLKVRSMSQYLEKVQAFAASELGVQFSVASWQEFAAGATTREGVIA